MAVRGTRLLALLTLAACARAVEDGADVEYSDPVVPAGHAEGSVAGGSAGSNPAAGPSAGEPGNANSGDRNRSGNDGGAGLTIAPPLAGEVLISEVMFDPSGSEPNGEWIEITSRINETRRLSGLTLKDGAGRTHLIDTPTALTIGPKQVVVLVRSRTGANTALVPSSTVAYEYGAGASPTEGILLTNGTSGGVALYNGATLIANAPFGAFAFASATGRSLQLKAMDPSSTATSVGWCVSQTHWAAGADFGTPGAQNDCR